MGSPWVLSPFLGAFIWAAMLIAATWPLLLIFAGVVDGLVAYTLLDNWVTCGVPVQV